jgi:hypothetical protein
MKPKNYFSTFAKMPFDAKIFTLTRALNIHPDKAKEILEKLEDELKYQETLLSLTQRKASITEQETELIEKLKLFRTQINRKKKQGEKERLIRLRYFWEIKKLREQGYGWRRIAEYIKKFHHKKISHVTLMKTYQKIEKEFEK